MKPQVIKTPGGDDMVIIPLADYEALLQQAGEETDGVEIELPPRGPGRPVTMPDV